MHEVAPSAVSTAEITDAMICSVHFKVSLFDIYSSFLPFRFYIGVISSAPSVISSVVERSLHALRLVEMTGEGCRDDILAHSPFPGDAVATANELMGIFS